jgi:hypothetical protein
MIYVHHLLVFCEVLALKYQIIYQSEYSYLLDWSLLRLEIRFHKY